MVAPERLPQLRLPSVPARLAPKLRAVARPVDRRQIPNFSNVATSRQSLPNVPTLRVSKPSVLGGTAAVPTAEADSTSIPADSTSIPIAVPNPETSDHNTPSPTNNQAATRPLASLVIVSRDAGSTTTTPGNILPVPSKSIPVGDVGAAASVWRSRDQQQPPAAKRTFTLRVYVPKISPDQLTQLREIVPDAFNATVNGTSVIQVGAFNDRAEAEALVNKLVSAGLTPVLDKY
ncbi:MAG: hypothetical protein HC805_05740 [Alkalinema sp. RL_2_19]|nr:hypothetical protein [Alkalinema sp. RL_2_19]